MATGNFFGVPFFGVGFFQPLAQAPDDDGSTASQIRGRRRKRYRKDVEYLGHVWTLFLQKMIHDDD